MYTRNRGQYRYHGAHRQHGRHYRDQTLVNGNEVPFEADGTFTHNYTLTSGTNYIEVKVMKNDIEQDVRHLAVFARPDFSPEKESFSGWTRLPMSESLKRARMFWHSCKSQGNGRYLSGI